MKTIKGKILSSTPISVSKAAKIIANFTATENGASQAVGAYLRRASASFNELKQFHRELQKASKSDRKRNSSKSGTTVEGAGESSLEPSVLNLTGLEASHGYGYSEGKKYKNKKKEENGEVGSSQNVEDRGNERKKEKNETDNFEGKEVIKEPSEKKKEKSGRKIENFQENGVNIEEGKLRKEEVWEGEQKKKRKRSEIDEGIERMSSSEPRNKKNKKKNRSGVDN